ncbi:MAG: hypothetical protein P0Y53_11535 [Candidatus Pseudobacter hemicellulosilyticus]|uniref:Uncharacterized protein n=1 Tax=Candidatus Pseudobacter hemicellulosilyticus TaxID=3121375 RepID=A0AAJ5WXS0_9BACT|nr:MAG: hypothetical protein P0Y53_11535 [Pseudobacter sp.]
MICLLLTGILACREKKPPPPAKLATPTILQGKSIDVASMLKRGKGVDLVEALYEELLAKSDSLQQLDQEIRQLKEQQAQVTDSFRLFDQKNKLYYQSANNKLPAIRDSLLRKKVMELLRDSRQRYDQKTSPFMALDSLLTQRNAAVADLYILLKIYQTLPLIEQYQQDHQPGTEPAENYRSKLDSLWRELDTMTQLPPSQLPR